MHWQISAIPSCGSICVVIGFCSTLYVEINFLVFDAQLMVESAKYKVW